MANLNYSELISRVVLDFDKVWTALNNKGTLVSATYGDADVSTANYGSLVDKLTLIGDGSTGLHTAAYFTSADTKALGAVSVVKSGSTYTVSSSTSVAGYYVAGTKLSGTITATTKDLTSARISNELILDEESHVYSLVASNYVIGEVTVNKATSTNASKIITGTIAADGTETPGDITSTLTFAEPTTAGVILDKNSDYKITISATGTTTGTISAKTTNTVTEGYITTNDKAAVSVVSYEIDEDASNTITVGIQAGTIQVNTASDKTITADVRSDDADVFATEGIAINASIDAESLSGALTATVTDGYVTSDGTTITMGTLSTTAGTKHIRVGESKDQIIDLDGKFSFDAGAGYFSESGKTVTITVADTATADIETGFIRATDAGTISASGTLDLKLTEATASAKWDISKFDKSGTLPANTTGGADAYTITVTPTVTVDTAGTTSGWIDGESDITTGMKANSKTAATYYVDKATLTMASEPSFVAALTEFTEGTGNANKPGMGTMTSVGDLFLDDKPEGCDYFTITSGLSYTLSAGYTSGASGTPTITRYLKKAVIEHVDTGVDGEDYYQVTSGGYLPSGVLSQISTVAPTVADVHINLTSADGIVSGAMAQGTTASDYYQINLAKGSIDAGYISKTKGTISGTGYIAKGSVSAQATIDATKGKITRVTGDNGAVSYQAVTTITAAPGVSFTPGYVASYTAPEATEETSTYTIDRVTFGTTTHTTNASVTPSGIITEAASDTSKYKVTPKIDSCSTQFTVASAGYVSAADTDILKFENSGTTHNGVMTALAIHAGTGIVDGTKTDSSDSITLTSDFATAASGNYTVTLAGSAKTTFNIDEGYYGTTEKTFTNVAVGVSKTMNVARGAATVAITGSNAITSNDVALTTENSGTVYAINATASANGTPTIATAGYVRDAADIKVTPNSNLATATYVKGYTGTLRSETNVAPEGTQKFTAITIGQDGEYAIPADKLQADVEIVLDTADKYSKKDTVVTLSADAMGKNVVNALIDLQARLDGAGAKTVSLA